MPTASARLRAVPSPAGPIRFTVRLLLMARSRKRNEPTHRRTHARDALAAGTARQPNWLRGKKPIFQFVGIFVVLMVGFYLVTFLPAMNNGFLPYYMKLNARMSAGVLNLFGEGASADGTMVYSPRYSVDIRHGCDAIEPSALFIAAVLAFPSRLLPKLPGLLFGTVVLSIINLFRIATLFFVGIHWPGLFEFMHEDVWQSLFVLIALVLWVLWAWWATRLPTRAKPDVTA
jgi:exosortase H (IPTLxxWG-CTERM-specific)